MIGSDTSVQFTRATNLRNRKVKQLGMHDTRFGCWYQAFVCVLRCATAPTDRFHGEYGGAVSRACKKRYNVLPAENLFRFIFGIKPFGRIFVGQQIVFVLFNHISAVYCFFGKSTWEPFSRSRLSLFNFIYYHCWGSIANNDTVLRMIAENYEAKNCLDLNQMIKHCTNELQHCTRRPTSNSFNSEKSRPTFRVSNFVVVVARAASPVLIELFV